MSPAPAIKHKDGCRCTYGYGNGIEFTSYGHPCDCGAEMETEPDWCKAYWDLMHNRLYSPEPMYSLLKENDNLRDLNHQQAAKIMELEFLLNCINRKGDTIIIDYQRLQRRHSFFKPSRLASSKWARPPNE